MGSSPSLAFGYAARAASTATRRKMDTFGALLGAAARLPITIARFESYDALTEAMHRRALDLAWLPPLPFLTLEERGEAIPLVAHHRGGASRFHGVILVRTESRIEAPLGLEGKRAAWVDRRSASGFVLPRIHLASLGLDPRRAFGAQRFFGSHDAVVRAVVGGKADFGATYARLDRSGGAVHGAWADLPGAEESIRVLLSFGKIPGDITATRPGLDPTVREGIARAMMSLCHDVEASMLVRHLFGVHEFRRWTPEGYPALRASVTRATNEGLLDDSAIASR